MRRHPVVHRWRERGVSLLEALITILILAFGILGLANLQGRMQTIEVESYARSQALIVLEDMASRLSANRAAAASYVTTDPVGTGDSQPSDCSTATTETDRDLCEWSYALKGRTESVGSAAVGAMIGGRGCIEQIAGAAPPSYRITVAWQGLSATTAPGVTCAQSLYGTNDAFRRAVVKVVSLAPLIP